MARKFLISVDLNKNELQNARVQNLGSAPSSPVAGQIYYNTSDNIMYFYNGSSWIPTSGSAEVIQDTVATMLQGGTGIDVTYNDPAGTLSIDIDSTVTTNSGTQTLTNKTIALGSNTVSGTLAEFNTALTDGDFATIAGSETLTNKTLTNPQVSGLYLSDGAIVFEGSTSDNYETILSVVDPTADRTLSLPNATGTIALVENKLHDFALATSDVNLNNNKLTNVATPVNPNDAANKAYVDAVSEGLHVHAAARVYVASNIDLSTDLEAGDVIDGITLVAGDRVLVNAQTTQSQNGIYIVQASGAAVRATDFDTATEVASGDFIFVSEGTSYGSTGWVQTLKPATIGTDPISFTQFSGAGTYTAGSGLTLTGTVFSADVTPTSGNPSLTNNGGAIEVKTDTTRGLSVDASGLGINAGTGFTFASGALAFASGYGVRKYAASVGDGAATSITVTHNFNTKDVTVHVYDNSSPYAQVETDIEHTNTNTITIKFAVAPATDQYRVVIVG